MCHNHVYFVQYMIFAMVAECFDQSINCLELDHSWGIFGYLVVIWGFH